METVKFYDTIPPMECFAGDTLPAFELWPDGLTSLTGCSMVLILESHDLGIAVLTKTCEKVANTVTGEHFLVQLTSADTADLIGSYRLHFVLTDSTSRDYEKLTGTLFVRPMVRGA